MPTFRRLQAPRQEEGVAKVVADIQSNFDQLKDVLKVAADDPPSGEIRFLVLEDDGTWHMWSILAGNNITLTQDDADRTLTINSSVPAGPLNRHWNDI